MRTVRTASRFLGFILVLVLIGCTHMNHPGQNLRVTTVPDTHRALVHAHSGVLLPEEYAPVCGTDGHVWFNEQAANTAGIKPLHRGECSAQEFVRNTRINPRALIEIDAALRYGATRRFGNSHVCFADNDCLPDEVCDKSKSLNKGSLLAHGYCATPGE